MDVYVEKHSGITRITSTKFSYKWTIQNYDLNDKKPGECLVSPPFGSYNRKDAKWVIKLYPEGQFETLKNCVSVYLSLLTEIPAPIKATASFSIINSEGSETHKEEIVSFTYEKPVAAGNPAYIKKDYLFNNKDNLLPNNTLTILCRVSIDTQIENLIGDHNTKHTEYQATLCNELETLFKNKELTDLTFIVNEKQLQAHKVILAAKSPVFLAMMQNDMKEKNCSVIEITDFEFNTISEMLLYLYTGKVENMDENCHELLRFADKYDIQGLKLLCEEYLCNQLCVDNAVETLITADRYNCNKSQIMQYILAHAKDIEKNPDFKNLPALVQEMIRVIIKT